MKLIIFRKEIKAGQLLLKTACQSEKSQKKEEKFKSSLKQLFSQAFTISQNKFRILTRIFEITQVYAEIIAKRKKVRNFFFANFAT